MVATRPISQMQWFKTSVYLLHHGSITPAVCMSLIHGVPLLWKYIHEIFFIFLWGSFSFERTKQILNWRMYQNMIVFMQVLLQLEDVMMMLNPYVQIWVPSVIFYLVWQRKKQSFRQHVQQTYLQANQNKIDGIKSKIIIVKSRTPHQL